MRPAIVLFAGLAACAIATAGTAKPAPRLAIASGSGTHRLAVWVKTNASGDICSGLQVGPSTAPPSTFTCLQGGLAPPIVEFESGGGLGAEATWGVIAGLASPSVTKLDALTLYGTKTTAPVALHAIPSFPGWHAFTTGVVPHPTSTQVAAYDTSGTLLTQVSGAIIHPPSQPAGGVITITPPGQPASGATWSDSGANLGALAPSNSSALSIVLADTTLKPIITGHGGWLESSGAWTNCDGRTLGTVFTFRFKSSATFTANLPQEGKPAGDFSYSESVQRIQATNWPGMLVFVDTGSHAVAGVKPDVDPIAGPTTIAAKPLATVVAAHDTGGPDNPTCWTIGG